MSVFNYKVEEKPTMVTKNFIVPRQYGENGKFSEHFVKVISHPGNLVFYHVMENNFVTTLAIDTTYNNGHRKLLFTIGFDSCEELFRARQRQSEESAMHSEMNMVRQEAETKLQSLLTEEQMESYRVFLDEEHQSMRNDHSDCGRSRLGNPHIDRER